MRKRVLVSVLSIVLAFCLIACGDDSSNVRVGLN